MRNTILLLVFFISNLSFSQITDTYTTSGTWVCPAGVTSVTVDCWGGGGAGGGTTLNTKKGGGGGAGGSYAKKALPVVPGNTYTVTVGTGATGAKSAGATGNPSWFNTSATVYAQGGVGGAAPNGGTANGGLGSSALCIGDLVYAGGHGANGTSTLSGGGGGGAGTTGLGGNASGTTRGTGTNVGGGNGANGRTNEGNGSLASVYGGGGSGAFVADASNHSGGSGANGAVLISYTIAPPDCTWKLYLADSYGDGWNGGSIGIMSGIVDLGTWTINSGYGGWLDIPIYLGDNIDLNYTAGSWSYENEYYLYDSYGNLVYSSGVGNTTPVDYIYLSADCDPHPLPPTEQDCLGAIPICGDTYSTVNSYVGSGNVANEINGGSSCLQSGEKNDVWYTFTVQQDGNLMFTITPNNLADDYDWAVYDLTNSSCSDIATDPTIEVSCNWSGTAGVTGPDGSTAFSSQTGIGTPFNAAIPVLVGQVYAINVSNYSSTQDGYTIDFSMSSGIIVDVTPPELQTIVSAPSCGEDQITAWFTEVVDTSTVNAGDFTVTGPGGPYSITTVNGLSNTAMDREYQLTLNSQLIAGGTYSLVFSGQVNDACGNIVTGNALNFTVTGISGSTIVDDALVICHDDNVGSATASATGGSGTYNYIWNTTETTATINNLTPGTYTVTISDNVGVCYDIVNAVVNPSNPTVAIGTWAGTSNSNWNNCANWGSGMIPLSSTDVTIPNGCPNYPVISSHTTINGTSGICNSLRIQNGGSLTINNAKNLTVDNSNVRVENGGLLNVNGNITIQNSGTIDLTGGNILIGKNFTNNANFVCPNGTVTLNGTVPQLIIGSQVSSFYNLTINNATEVILNINTVVNNNLTMTSGDLNIAGFEVDLGTTGTLVNETASSRVKSLDGLGIPMAGGTLKATRTNPSGNVAGLGLDITPSAPLGNTVIIRGHDELQGTGTYVANRSILRYYDITADNSKAVLTNDLVFSYFDVELNGHIDGTLIMFQEVQETWGGVPGPIFWKPLSTSNNAVANTASASTVNNNLITTKITLGSDAIPLPIELMKFEAQCENNYTDLIWETSSEQNNDYFTIEKSYDGIDFKEIGRISGNGNSNELLNYSFTDYEANSNTAYYLLKQTNFDGSYTYSKMISSNCNSNETGKINIKIYPNPTRASSKINIELNGIENSSEISISIIDMLGQKVISKIISVDEYNTYLKVSLNIDDILKAGSYIVRVTSNNDVAIETLIISGR